MVGLAVGDCLGRAVEGHRSVPDNYVDDLVGRSSVMPYSDDTVMAMALVESLLGCDGFSGGDMASRFVREWQAEPHRGYGSGVTRYFDRVSRGVPWDEAARQQFGGEGSLGNGGAMRVAPVALWAYPDLEATVRLARETARVTHTHPAGVDGAVVQAVAAYHALGEELDPVRLLDELLQRVDTEAFRDKLRMLGECLQREDDDYARLRLGNWVSAANSVPVALYSFLLGDDFEAVIRRAVGMGGDTDTIAAMAGALAGSRWGLEEVPGEWRQVEGCERLLELADALYARIQGGRR